MNGSRLVKIAVARPVPGPFTYRVPEPLAGQLAPGRRVVVPFGRGKAVGFAIGEATEAPPGELRDVSALLDDGPIFGPELLALLEWTADYYRYPLGEVLRSALPPGFGKPEEAPAPRALVRELVAITDEGRSAPAPRGAAMRAILAYLSTASGEVDLEELATAIPKPREPLSRLVEKGLCRLRAEPIVPERPELALAGQTPPEPTRDQQAVLAEIHAALDEAKFAPFLLHGVTGSGKTEVYLRAISRALELGRGALVLVPEIALTPQLVGRFRARFGDRVAVLHSGLKDAERLAEWRRLRGGQTNLAVGVRSAIFAPVDQLGLVIVDEEHDGSFKQDEKLRYNARDLAVVRARQAGCPVVLGSATPSLETLHNARSGRYRLLPLERRIDDRPMPEVQLVDMRLSHGSGHVGAAFPQLAAKAKIRAYEEQKASEAGATYKVQGSLFEKRTPKVEAPPPAPPESGVPASALEAARAPLLSEALIQALGEVLAKGRQAILFLNRRGTSTYHVCLACGGSLTCPNCAVSLTQHGLRGTLMCHYCGHQQPVPVACPKCKGPIEALGMGTEQVEAKVAECFPQARLCRLDRDAVTAPEEVTAVLAGFAKGEKDVLIGTQMVAKGHDFPGVTLVGVLLADLALNLPDFRAAERTFQLLAQVAGRAGRGKEPGTVLVQTFNPEAPAIAHVVGHDYLRFAEQELALRKAYLYPPFCRLVSVRIEGMHPLETAEAARRLARAAANVVRGAHRNVRLLGPAPAPIARIRGKTRWQLLLKGPTSRELTPIAQVIEKAAQDLPGNVRATIDVDPLAML